MTDYLIFDGLSRFLWSITIIILFFSGIHLTNRALKKNDYEEKVMMLGFASLFFGLAINRLFFYLSDYFVHGYYSGHAFYGNHLNYTSQIYLIIVYCAYSSFIIGLTFFFFAYELTLKRSKKYLTVMNVILLILFNTVPFNIKRHVFFLTIFIDTILILRILTWYSHNAKEELQVISNLMLIGFIFILFGSILDFSFLKELKITNPTNACFFMMMGALISISPTIINPNYLSKGLLSWILLAASISFILIQGMFYFILFYWEYPLIFVIIAWILIIGGFFFIIFAIFNVVRILTSTPIISEMSEDDVKNELLKMFIKPIKITEQELKERSAQTAHELRTPLVPLYGFSQLLLDDYNDILDKIEDINEYYKNINESNITAIFKLHKEMYKDFKSMKSDIGYILESAEKLNSIAEYFLNIRSKDGVVFKKESRNLNELIKNSIQLFKPQANERNIEIIFDNTEDFSLNINDENSLRIVLNNLISNALKNSFENSQIMISIKNIKHRIQISVQDFGIGLTPYEMKKIFTNPKQIKRENDDKTKGSGIGLKTSKKIIKEHSGRIWAESEGRNKGTTFFIEVPHQ